MQRFLCLIAHRTENCGYGTSAESLLNSHEERKAEAPIDIRGQHPNHSVLTPQNILFQFAKTKTQPAGLVTYPFTSLQSQFATSIHGLRCCANRDTRCTSYVMQGYMLRHSIFALRSTICRESHKFVVYPLLTICSFSFSTPFFSLYTQQGYLELTQI